MDARPRLVPLDGSFNFRDLGGYPTGDGRVTRWETLFRADTLHELTPDDVARLRSLGLTTIVDLRTARELEHTGRGPLGPEPIGYHHLSVIQEGESGESVAAPASPGDDLSDRYLWYLDVGRGSLVAALGLVADAANLPLVFHCAAGKDRTGVLAALILSMLGVDDQVVVDDYLITEGRMELILGRYRSDPAFANRMSRLPSSRFGVTPETMVRFLGELDRRFGGARHWALEAGLPRSAIDRMEELLLDPMV